ncbi:MAG TPA: CDP-archaeol synthase [Candidatus Nanoarchaeia archaeon]|nr:CDP-archaeol synthase [Candidatus Nanoarchaeia archaeon]
MSLFNFLILVWATNVILNILGVIKKLRPAMQRFDRPIDGGLILPDGSRLLGESTTWVGLFVTAIVGVIVFWTTNNFYTLAVVFLVYVGHAVGSFIKRRLDVEDGGFVPMIDHGDHVLVAGTFVVLVDLISLFDFVLAFVLTVVLTPVVTTFFHKIGWRERGL